MAVHGCWSLIHNISCPSATAQLTLLKQPSCVTKLFTSYVNIYVYIYIYYIYIYIYIVYILYIYTAKLHQIAIFMLFQFMLFSYSSWRYESGIDHGLQAFAKEVAQCAVRPASCAGERARAHRRSEHLKTEWLVKPCNYER